jgi:hypothetical protein
LLAPIASGCEPAKQPEQPTVSLRMRGTPVDATVIVDDEPLGSLEFVAAHGVALPPGKHYVTVTAQGYFPWDREIVAKLGQGAIALEVALTRVPD